MRDANTSMSASEAMCIVFCREKQYTATAHSHIHSTRICCDSQWVYWCLPNKQTRCTAHTRCQNDFNEYSSNVQLIRIEIKTQNSMNSISIPSSSKSFIRNMAFSSIQQFTQWRIFFGVFRRNAIVVEHNSHCHSSIVLAAILDEVFVSIQSTEIYLLIWFCNCKAKFGAEH